MIQVYLLAAGNGRRAGRPKAWLEVSGLPLLQRQIEFLNKKFPPSSIAVSIQPQWEERCQALCRETHWISVDAGQPALASLQSLAKKCPPADWAFVYHVDMPVWQSALFEALEARGHVSKAQAVVPANGGRRGHPVLVRGGAISATIGLDGRRDRLDVWLRGQTVEVLDTPWPCVLENWNEGVPA